MHRFKFGIRSALIFTALLGTFLAWRCQHPDSSTARSVESAGGKVYYAYQNVDYGKLTWDASNRKPGYRYFNEITLSTLNVNSAVYTFLFAPKSEFNITAIELDLAEFTPSMLDQIAELNHLKFLMVRMPDKAIKYESTSLKRLGRIKKKFGTKMYATAKLR